MGGLCAKPPVNDDEIRDGGAAQGAVSTTKALQGPMDPSQNIIMLTDSYKVTHHKQYPPGTTVVYSYFECRGGAYEETVFFGLQYFIKNYLMGQVVTKEKIDEAQEYFDIHFSTPVWGKMDVFNRKGWEHILNKHGGRLPVSIKAVPEGTVVPYKNVLLTIENTDPECYWLPNYLETLLVQVWYPITVATQSREQYKIIGKYMKSTGAGGDPMALVGFKLHDFGFRGVSSVESAAIGGAAHLVNSMGTDTMAALMCCKKFYHEQFAGFSIPASEHSTMTSWGKEGEAGAMRNMLDKYPKGLVACVSDSYDIFNACKNIWGKELKEKIMAREGFLVVRPDSGELPGIVVDVLNALGENFPTTTTETGHKMLPPQLRVIQGDGISIESLPLILDHMAKNGWCADNLAFGSGGALLQKLHRDTLKCAFKCSYCKVNGKDVDVFKDPITDPGKKSKKGRLTLQKSGSSFQTITEGKGSPRDDVLQEVFRDGILLVDQKFADIKARAALP